MWISTSVKKKFSEPKTLLNVRFSASKFAFTMSSLIFFVNYYLVSDQFGTREFLLYMLPFTYVSFLLSFVFFTYYVIKSQFYWKLNPAAFIWLLVVLLIIATLLSVTFLLPKDLIPNVL